MNLAEQNLHILIPVTISLILFRRTSPVFLQILLIGMIVFELMNFSKQQYMLDTSAFLLGVTVLVYAVYSFWKKRYLRSVLGTLIIIPVIFQFFLYDHHETVAYISIASMVLSAYLIFHWKQNMFDLALIIMLAFQSLKQLYTII
ncbi:MAG: hypothetical protein HKN92_04755 [Chitinophagales bacterium]|nr:hypothetical protein [Chitinophagales bacterium]